MSYSTDKFDEELVGLLKQGAIGLLPSDTIYGISGLALDRSAVERIHQAKRRDKNKPLIVLISRIDQLESLGITSTNAAPALRYWPGRLTLICDAADAPEWLHKGTATLAVRQPDYEELRELIDKTGPLVSTSANISGTEPAKTVKEAKEYFGDKLDFYMDAGRLSGKPSTLARVTFDKLKVIREGAVKVKKKDLL